MKTYVLQALLLTLAVAVVRAANTAACTLSLGRATGRMGSVVSAAGPIRQSASMVRAEGPKEQC
ncbi:hypothetical protein IscW_ISCW012261 [Ixodes scapularis]|uniref:Secreted protein n=1 Tax=Ixodes scapularis TaxID=6945 RepID=B7QA09_IXOSC|nr:hypothetical protein IscW_ISCW012261 [Ixodes scapularis]|eukprot:XP_002399671.1 hypothetical protein IscW_ISCW012261 [Ixodes scapularis]